MQVLHLGIDIGGTNVKFGLLDSSINLFHYHSTKLPITLSQIDLYLWLVEEIRKILSNFPSVETIGIGYPGVVDISGKILVSPNVSQLVGFELKQNLEKDFERRIAVDNDANVAALAELKFGNGAGLQNFVYVTLGTGVGGALVLNGEIFRGTNYGAGEIGHTIINPYDELNQENPFRTGVLEEYLGKEAIIRTAKNLARKYEKSPIVKNELWDVADISDYSLKGDALSIETMRLSGYYLGLAIVSVANLLDIPNFILGGGISKSAEIFYESAANTARQRVLPQIAPKLQIRQAKFTEKSGIFGAAIFGMQ